MKTPKHWLEDLVWEQTKDVVYNREHPKDQTADLVKLILELHNDEFSVQSRAFLQRLNINPSKYWKKYHDSTD